MSWEPIHEMFGRMVERSRERVAVEGATRAVTYGWLEEESARLASLFRHSGVVTGSRVAILCQERERLIAAILACLKEGLVFVPLDPAFPQARLEAFAAEVEPACWVVEHKLVERICGRPGVGFIVLDGEGGEPREVSGWKRLQTWPAAMGERDDAPSAAPSDPDGMCSIYFTSGSTGRPKAIAGRLKGIDHFIRWEMDLLGVGGRGDGPRVSQLTSPAFDASLRDIFLPLCSGGVACAPPDWKTVLDPRSLADWLERSRIEVVHCVPSLLRALLGERLSRDRFPELRWIALAGERLLSEDVRRWTEIFGERVRLINLYGATETTMTKLYHLVSPVDGRRSTVPVGRPMPGTRAVVLDEQGRVCPPGMVGEIYVRTPYRSLGYFNRPDLTREVFVPNPLTSNPDDVVYRTGDFGRILEDGTFVLVGRRDHQVKIRGARVELGEVENLLRCHGAVRDLAVVDSPGDQGEVHLVAYVVLDRQVAPGELRRFCAEQLPDYMVPSLYLPLSAIPRTVNGKLDREALPSLADREETSWKGRVPRGAVEELLAEIWRALLGLDTLGAEEDFFELGGHSLLAVRLLVRIRAGLGVELELRSVFEHPTIAQLARLVEAARSGPVAPRLEPADRGSEVPLSWAQERLWFLQRLAPANSAYNVVRALRLRGPLGLDALERAFGEVVRRHESLRTRFADVEGRPVQIIEETWKIPLPVLDLRGLPEPLREEEVRRQFRDLSGRPFDLGRAPLLRVMALRLGGEEHALLIALHHIVSDAWSVAVLTDEVTSLYRSAVEGRALRLPELPVQYADYAIWQRRWLQGEILEREISYWRDRLAAAPELLELPIDHPRPPVQSSRGASCRFRLEESLSQRIVDLGRRCGATLFMTLLAVFQTLLARSNSRTDICVGTTVAGRNHLETERLIGLFVNTLVQRADLSGAPGFSEVLARVRETALGAHAHQNLPFEKLVEELRPPRTLSHTPLFQVLFVFHNAPRSDASLPGVAMEAIEPEVTSTKFDLTMSLTSQGGWLAGALEYRTDLFEAPTVRRLLQHFRMLLEAVVEDPERPVGEIPLLTEPERWQAIGEWNDTTEPVGRSVPVHRLFEEQARRAPEATALVFGGERLSYGDLDRWTNRLARQLVALGVGPDMVVGVLLERSLEMVAALLAALKAGGAYLPLDPRSPSARLALLVEESRPVVILTQTCLAGLLPADTPGVLVVSRAWEDLPAMGDGPVGVEPEPENLAYVIYTSGSTGRPKGVMNHHRGLLNRIVWMQDAFRLGEDDRLLQKTPFTFDVSVWEFFWPLAYGARLVVAKPEGHRDPAYLQRLIADEEVTTVHFVPSMLQTFLEEPELASRCSSLRRVIASGEALSPDLRKRFFERFRCGLHNLYGPTEAAIDVTAWCCSPEEHGPVPIGRPIKNTRIHLLDPAFQPVPIGITGELCIGGVQPARGYLGRPDLTAERFVPDPCAAEHGMAGARLYRTGDLARYHAAGEIEYLGRRDHQVKIRGFRIELGEIEAVLVRHPEVRECVVAVADGARLVSYVAPRVSERVAAGLPDAVFTADLKDFLRRELPDYMVPSRVVLLERLPLGANGKLDRKALPSDLAVADISTFVPPSTPGEAELATIWAELLRADHIGTEENFFDLGGHSLLATQVLAQVRSRFGVELSLEAFFRNPTVRSLAARIEEALLALSSADDLEQMLELLDEIDDEETGRLLTPGADPAGREGRLA